MMPHSVYMLPGMTRNRLKVRMLSETCGADRVSLWGQRAIREVQEFALLLQPGSEVILQAQNDLLYINTGSDSGAQWINKEQPDFF